jgi:3-hydroxyisobutyrate dehydrogenase/glyoxylate/succinic semialdehyde reductase
MSRRLLDSTGQLLVWNRTREKADELLEGGAGWRDSAAAVAEEVGVIFTMLADPPAVREVAYGENGFLQHLAPGSLWVDCSTVGPSVSREMAERCRQAGIHFLDAPVAGSIGPAERGELTTFVGGDAEDLEVARPFIQVWSDKIFHMGDIGSGSTMKLVINALLGLEMAGVEEVLHLGTALGLQEDDVLDAILGSAACPPFIATKQQNLLSKEYPASFPLKWMYKDLHLAANAGYDAHVAAPLINAVKELFALGVEQGLGELDFSGIAKLHERLEKSPE